MGNDLKRRKERIKDHSCFSSSNLVEVGARGVVLSTEMVKLNGEARIRVSALDYLSVGYLGDI